MAYVLYVVTPGRGPVHLVLVQLPAVLLTDLRRLQNVGDRVECYTGDWELGTVVKQWYREAEWAEGVWTAYQVMLDSGQYMYVPLDLDKVCKRAIEPEPELQISEDEQPLQKPKMTWAEIGKWDT